MPNRFLFTTGNQKGIGLEVSLKALLKENDDTIKIIFCNKIALEKHVDSLNLGSTNYNFIANIEEATTSGLYFYTEKEPLDWFKESVDFCEANSDDTALITGPMSKDQFKDKKIKGHTSFFEHRFKDNDLFMTFIGSIYNCLLLTDHVPLLKIDINQISKRLPKAIKEIKKLNALTQSKKPIGLLGFNPHSGEKGLLGSEELEVHFKELERHKDVDGPLPADGFFSKDDYMKFSFLIANYHDQGLIPFKLLNGFKACQTTLGLPFVRTSVNHGTAEELYLKDRADSSSLLFAYKTAKTLLEGRNKSA